jgi:hypothetical protein
MFSGAFCCHVYGRCEMDSDSVSTCRSVGWGAVGAGWCCWLLPTGQTLAGDAVLCDESTTEHRYCESNNSFRPEEFKSFRIVGR